jgi:hypothetical protein
MSLQYCEEGLFLLTGLQAQDYIFYHDCPNVMQVIQAKTVSAEGSRNFGDLSISIFYKKSRRANSKT